MLKGTRSFVVIESVDKSQTLVEKFLCHRSLRGNRVMKISQADHQRDRTGPGNLRRIWVLLSEGSRAGQRRAENEGQGSHGFLLEMGLPRFVAAYCKNTPVANYGRTLE